MKERDLLIPDEMRENVDVDRQIQAEVTYALAQARSGLKKRVCGAMKFCSKPKARLDEYAKKIFNSKEEPYLRRAAFLVGQLQISRFFCVGDADGAAARTVQRQYQAHGENFWETVNAGLGRIAKLSAVDLTRYGDSIKARCLYAHDTLFFQVLARPYRAGLGHVPRRLHGI